MTNIIVCIAIVIQTCFTPIPLLVSYHIDTDFITIVEICIRHLGLDIK